MKPPHRAAEFVNGVIRPRCRVDNVAFDIRQDLAALSVKAVPHDAGRSCKAHLLQMEQQGMDRACPWTRLTDDHLAISRDGGPSATGERRWFVFFGHLLTISAASACRQSTIEPEPTRGLFGHEQLDVLSLCGHGPQYCQERLS
jgi:hypothetical protein